MEGNVEVLVRFLDPIDEQCDVDESMRLGIILQWISSETDPHVLYLKHTLSELIDLETSLTTEQGNPDTVIRDTFLTYQKRFISTKQSLFTRQHQTERFLWQLEQWMVLHIHQYPTSRVLARFLLPFMAPVWSLHQYQCLEAIMNKCLEGSDVLYHGLSSGCTQSQQISVDKGMVVLWKFSFQGKELDFLATISTQAYQIEEDPYTCMSSIVPTKPEIIYNQTTYGTSGSIYGLYIANTCGCIELEWTNTDTTSIFSKQLEYQTRTIHFPPDLTTGAPFELQQLVTQASKEQLSPCWLKGVLQDRKWTILLSDLDQSGETYNEYNLVSDESEPVSLQPQNDSRDRRILELEHNLIQVQEVLATTRQELKSAQNELEISSEVYKASLETIARLEVSSVSRHQDRWDNEEPEANDWSSDEDKKSEDEDDDNHEIKRLKDLCAAFQEQCLWRSIETTESEKRNLLLQTELEKVQEHVVALREQGVLNDTERTQLQKENQKLRAQKTLLVQEVRRLQPFSQVNIAGLIQEAEEARMMQRSLQRQLDELRGQHHESSGSITNPECVPERLEEVH